MLVPFVLIAGVFLGILVEALDVSFALPFFVSIAQGVIPLLLVAFFVEVGGVHARISAIFDGLARPLSDAELEADAQKLRTRYP